MANHVKVGRQELALVFFVGRLCPKGRGQLGGIGILVLHRLGQYSNRGREFRPTFVTGCKG